MRTGSVNPRKHSAKSFLHVLEGSKRISSSVILASWLRSFLFRVSDNLSCGSPGVSGFSFDAVSFILSGASEAHLCGFPLGYSLLCGLPRRECIGILGLGYVVSFVFCFSFVLRCGFSDLV